MRCPYCGKDDTRVIDSRPVEDNNSIRRRRICDSCSRRFTTYEKIETIPMMVTKKDNNREAYDRSKIEGGILRACHKRPVSAAQIKKIVDEIEAEVFERDEKKRKSLSGMRRRSPASRSASSLCPRSTSSIRSPMSGLPLSTGNSRTWRRSWRNCAKFSTRKIDPPHLEQD